MGNGLWAPRNYIKGVHRLCHRWVLSWQADTVSDVTV